MEPQIERPQLEIPPKELLDRFSALLKEFNALGFVLSAQIGFRKPEEIDQGRASNFNTSLASLPPDVQAQVKKVIPPEK